MKINQNIASLSEEYLFSEIGGIIKSKSDVINLTIGDVKLPLPAAVVEAGRKAAEELKSSATFRGYPPESGYDFLKSAVKGYYKDMGVDVDEDEIFVSDGIKNDLSLLLSMFGKSRVLLPAPSYPAYIDANIIRGNQIGFYSDVTDRTADLIIICSPDNPTGKTLSRGQLEEWVRVAKHSGSIILYDAAYEAFISGDYPRSILGIEGARECAIEMCSLSKTAGFTGVRCGYTVVPKECGLNKRWKRLKSCMTNGVSYITQRMAECALTTSLAEVRENIGYYKRNAEIMMNALHGAEFSGGKNSPYIWLSCGDSRKAFEVLLNEYGLGVTPGIGFGEAGEGHVRINSFCLRDDAINAAVRLKSYLEKFS